jgi:protein-disulfide isomerase
MSTLRRTVDRTDWARGPADARVTLLEYGDYECPFCGHAFWELKKLEQSVTEPIASRSGTFP